MENREPGFYSITPATVRYDSELTPLAKLLFGEISALCTLRGFCWAGNGYFADLYEVTTRTVSRTINQLRERGYIRIEMIESANGNERNLYMTPLAIEGLPGGAWTKMSEGVDKNVSPPLDKNVSHSIKVKNTTKNTYALDIVELYSQRLPGCRPLDPDSTIGRKALKRIIARAADKDWGREISPWIELFDECDNSKYLKSQNWFGLDWLVKVEENIDKVLSGQYRDAATSRTAGLTEDKLSADEAAHYEELEQ